MCMLSQTVGWGMQQSLMCCPGPSKEFIMGMLVTTCSCSQEREERKRTNKYTRQLRAQACNITLLHQECVDQSFCLHVFQWAMVEEWIQKLGLKNLQTLIQNSAHHCQSSWRCNPCVWCAIQTIAWCTRPVAPLSPVWTSLTAQHCSRKLDSGTIHIRGEQKLAQGDDILLQRLSAPRCVRNQLFENLQETVQQSQHEIPSWGWFHSYTPGNSMLPWVRCLSWAVQ